MKIVKVFVQGNQNPIGEATILLNDLNSLTINLSNYNDWNKYAGYFVYPASTIELEAILLLQTKYFENAKLLQDFKKSI